MTTPIEVTLAGVIILAAVHMFIGRLRFIDVIPRSRWLSLAGGVSVAYVFLHIIPELSLSQQLFSTPVSFIGVFERHVYLIALAGLVTFYALERLVRTSRKNALERGSDRPSSSVYVVNIASFMAYNFLIAYLLVHRIIPGPLLLIMFIAAFALHFMVVDFGLRKDHLSDYDRSGRYLLIASLVLGWMVGNLYTIHEMGVAIIAAFLGGGVILNVLKEELPEERRGRIFPFVIGVAGYALLLLFV
ncbi:MAG: hypothetical protein GX369_01710 [Euryarchaeota archaeon]|nr:hypothetical protein [Euryarchaeota archaeon]